ncbi:MULTISPECIES: DUF6685 family protein [unclassified Pseudoalteromonas]|uniref:DUF6685 family protein n=1 Tax=unclassified Pseudoalteromonas TaxID=194690 RepID=UPI000F77D27F|nr:MULTISPECIES: DUF6685 family protein [unclassified Pseudoalteromonas]
MRDNCEAFQFNLVESKSISLDDVTQWHTLAQEKDFRIWVKSTGPKPRVKCEVRDSIDFLDKIGVTSSIDSYRCDISEIKGFRSSKSNLSLFSSMDQLATTSSPELVNTASREDFGRALAWHDFPNQNNSKLVVHDWDKRFFIDNSNGSHHFAVARYLSKKFKALVSFDAPLLVHGLSPAAVSNLTNNYHVYVLPLNYSNLSGIFLSLLERLGTHPITFAMPSPFSDKAEVLLLKKSTKLSMPVAEILSNYALFNLGDYLRRLIEECDF